MLADDGFQAPWWLRNSHVQSCYSLFYRSREGVPLHWSSLELPDGDFVDLCWADAPPSACEALRQGQATPLVVLLHGLEGSVHSFYMQAMVDAIYRMGWRSVTLHARGCGLRLNRLPRLYAAGDFADLAFLVEALQRNEPNTPLFGVGFSVGGNMLLKYLAHELRHPFQACVGVSVPFDMGATADYLSPLYEWRLLFGIKQKLQRKLSAGMLMPVDQAALKKIATLRVLDRHVTAPMFGYRDEEDYYRTCSALHTMPMLGDRPLLLLHALDDPFIPEAALPDPAMLPESVQLRVYPVGGHLGFVAGGLPWRPHMPVLEEMTDFLSEAWRAGGVSP